MQCPAAICRDGYVLRAPANEYCYRFFQVAEDFSAANRSCVRNGANLVFIESAEENSYLQDTFFETNGQTEFWIGLNDLTEEGDFRYKYHRPWYLSACLLISAAYC